MKTNLELKREKTDKIIANNFKTSCMNNAKWVKLLDALIKNDHLIPEILLKLVWDENLRKLHLDGTTSWNFDYYPKAMESMVSGRPYGWYAYKEIEWIEFQNNGTAIAKLLDSIGKFDYQLHEIKLKLFGYRSNQPSL